MNVLYLQSRAPYSATAMRFDGTNQSRDAIIKWLDVKDIMPPQEEPFDMILGYLNGAHIKVANGKWLVLSELNSLHVYTAAEINALFTKAAADEVPA